MIDNQVFKFRDFSIQQLKCTMKVGTDGILLGAWCKVKSAKEVLDIGTGTGLIALMIAQRTSSAIITAVEVDEESSKEAASNFNSSPWKERLHLSNLSIQNYSKVSKTDFDLIVCNPPFFSGGTLSSNQDKNTVRHTIKLSHQDLLRSVRSLLSSKGVFCVILPLIEGLRFIELANTYGFFCTKKTSVFAKEGKPVERLLIEFSKIKKDTESSNIIIYETEGGYTKEYKELTKDFYLNPL